MRIIISARESSLDGEPDERFGRAPLLLKVDPATLEWESYPNPGVNQSSGAGVAAAQFVIDQKVSAVISGDFGPHASRAFQSAHIEMRLLSEESTSIRKTVELFNQGKLSSFRP